jgi:hypothetical protein
MGTEYNQSTLYELKKMSQRFPLFVAINIH